MTWRTVSLLATLVLLISTLSCSAQDGGSPIVQWQFADAVAPNATGMVPAELLQHGYTNGGQPLDVLRIPTIGNDMIIWSTTEGDVWAIPTGTGRPTLTWHVRLEASTWGCVRYSDWAGFPKGIVVVTDGNGFVSAFDASAGQALWSTDLADGPIFTSSYILGDRVYATTYAGTLAAMGIDTGAEIWKAKLNESIVADMTSDLQNTLYMVSVDGVLLAVDTGSGGVLWELNLGFPSTLYSQVQLHDTSIYVSLDGALVCVERGEVAPREIKWAVPHDPGAVSISFLGNNLLFAVHPNGFFMRINPQTHFVLDTTEFTSYPSIIPAVPVVLNTADPACPYTAQTAPLPSPPPPPLVAVPTTGPVPTPREGDVPVAPPPPLISLSGYATDGNANVRDLTAGAKAQNKSITYNVAHAGLIWHEGLMYGARHDGALSALSVPGCPLPTDPLPLIVYTGNAPEMSAAPAPPPSGKGLAVRWVILVIVVAVVVLVFLALLVRVYRQKPSHKTMSGAAAPVGPPLLAPQFLPGPYGSRPQSLMSSDSSSASDSDESVSRAIRNVLPEAAALNSGCGTNGRDESIWVVRAAHGENGIEGDRKVPSALVNEWSTTSQLDVFELQGKPAAIENPTGPMSGGMSGEGSSRSHPASAEGVSGNTGGTSGVMFLPMMVCAEPQTPTKAKGSPAFPATNGNHFAFNPYLAVSSPITTPSLVPHTAPPSVKRSLTGPPHTSVSHFRPAVNSASSTDSYALKMPSTGTGSSCIINYSDPLPVSSAMHESSNESVARPPSLHTSQYTSDANGLESYAPEDAAGEFTIFSPQSSEESDHGDEAPDELVAEGGGPAGGRDSRMSYDRSSAASSSHMSQHSFHRVLPSVEAQYDPLREAEMLKAQGISAPSSSSDDDDAASSDDDSPSELATSGRSAPANLPREVSLNPNDSLNYALSMEYEGAETAAEQQRSSMREPSSLSPIAAAGASESEPSVLEPSGPLSPVGNAAEDPPLPSPPSPPSPADTNDLLLTMTPEQNILASITSTSSSLMQRWVRPGVIRRNGSSLENLSDSDGPTPGSATGGVLSPHPAHDDSNLLPFVGSSLSEHSRLQEPQQLPPAPALQNAAPSSPEGFSALTEPSPRNSPGNSR